MDSKSFMQLVAEMRTAQKRFWTGDRSRDDLTAALSLEKSVDDEIKRVAVALRARPERQPADDTPDWQFFCKVTCLRDKSKKYFAEKKRLGRLNPTQQRLGMENLRQALEDVQARERDIDRIIRRTDDDEKRAQGITIIWQVIRHRTGMKEPQVVLTTRDEKYANLECYGMNEKSRDGCRYYVKRIEQK